MPRWCGASPEFIAKAKLQLGIAGTEQLFVRFGDDFRRVHTRYAGPAEFSPDQQLIAISSATSAWDRFSPK